MDSGRFLLAVVLMIALVVVTNVLFPPVPRSPAAPPDSAAPAAGDTAPPRGAGSEPAAPVRPDPVSTPRPVEAADIGAAATDAITADTITADTIVARSELYHVGISTRGASIVRAQLDRHRSMQADGPVELVPEAARALVSYRLEIGRTVIDLSRLPFRADATAGIAVDSSTGERTVRLTHADSATGFAAELAYTFRPSTYLVDVRARVSAPQTETPRLLLDMGPALRFNEANVREDAQNLAFVVNGSTQGIASVPFSKLEAARTENGPLAWVALKNKYFVVAAVRTDAGQPFGGVIASPTGRENEVELTATLLPETDGQFAFRLYLGPQEPDQLAVAGHDLRDVYVFGWKFLQPVLRPIGHAITWALVGLHNVMSLGYGWVLILFGIIIRVVLWPLNAKAMRSQLKTMELQPRIKEIQARYKTEPEKMQKEMLRLYKEEGFNPMGGCLPMLLPFPILITLFFVFQSTIEFRGVPFLWLPDLSQADPLFVLPVLLGLSMFLLQWLNLRAAPAGSQQAQMKIMMYVMPVFMTVLFLNFASGLNLYYASMNFASLPQQLQIIKERKRWHASRQ